MEERSAFSQDYVRYSEEASWKPWVAALRLRTLSASLAPVLMATFLSFSLTHGINALIASSAILAAFFIQMATNLINDALDYKKGADGKQRTGPIRLVQSGQLTIQQVYRIGLVSFLIALLCGIPLILQGGFLLLAILILSCLCGYLYTGGPYPLAYNGLGELFVILFFGIVLTSSVFYLQTKEWDIKAVIAGIQMGLLATTLIAINNLRDSAEDIKVHKLTLAVRYGMNFSKTEISFCVLTPFIIGFYWILQDKVLVFFLPFFVLPLALLLVYKIWVTPPGPIYNQLIGMGGLVQLAFSLLASLGFYLEA